jgi:hypothetical protein
MVILGCSAYIKLAIIANYDAKVMIIPCVCIKKFVPKKLQKVMLGYFASVVKK